MKEGHMVERADSSHGREPITTTTADIARRKGGRHQIMIWVWGSVQIGVSLLVAIVLLPNVSSDATLISVLRPLIAIVGSIVGVSFIIFQYQINSVVKKEIEALNTAGRAERQRYKDDMEQTVRQGVSAELHDLRKLLPIFDAYLSIGGGDSYGARDRILNDARHLLEEAARGKIELEGDAYYDWLKERLVNRRPEIVRAISCRPLSVYSVDPREKNFIRDNIDAIKKGTAISRIFVLDEPEIMDLATRSVLKDHFCNSRARCFVAWKERLSCPLREKLEGGGMSIYDNDHVFFDQSYFAMRLGEERGIGGVVSGSEVIPKACVYSVGHAEFSNLINIYNNLLNNFVDPALKDVDCNAAYKAICEHVLSWGAANSAVDSALQELRDEISALEKL
jgi:hypothetical protein